jgi:putative DNA primase/helicase
VIEDADNDRRLLLHAKNNLAPAPAGLAYRIKEKIVGEPGKAITAPCVVWEPDTVLLTANEAMAADASAEGSRSALSEAEEFLRDLLSDGGVAAKAVKAEAQSAGLGWATVRRAKDRLGIKPKREGFQEQANWVWELPKVLKNPEDAQPKNMSTFENDEHLRPSGRADNDYCPELPRFLDRRAQGAIMSIKGSSNG